MKTKIKIAICLMLFLSITTWAQAPQKISYQSVIRNNSNALIVNSTVGMKVSLLQGGANGLSVYSETHKSTTNANGLVSLAIGTGTVIQGVFANIDWSTGSYFVKTEIDPTGGVNYTLVGTSELLSVPYALYASKSGSGGSTGGGTSNWTESTFNSVPYMYTNDNIKVTSIIGRDILDAQAWYENFYQMPNAALNVSSPLGTLSADGLGLQTFVWDVNGAENKVSNLYLNRFGGNTGIGFSSLAPSAQATLTVKRGYDSPWGTAAFEGTGHVSHFNYGTDEHTYIRGGKTGANIYLNDSHNGSVILGNSNGKVAVNADATPLASTFTVRTSTGSTSTADFFPQKGVFNAITNCASTFNFKLDDGTGRFESTFIRGGSVGARVWLNDAHNGDVIIANGGGNVGIGTTNPTYKLAVNGSLRAKEIRVDSDWADFVFEKEYKLRPLAEVEKYILEHKHLPEIPAAKEIEGTEGGLNVGEMSKLFMQKIEELTLYMIEANKQIENNNKQIQELKKENEVLKNSISKQQ
jgi:hypothetical protein